jgi:predicted Rossmann fold nucleotide-binding protein DprA/Smf involved in DNA uptake
VCGEPAQEQVQTQGQVQTREQVQTDEQVQTQEQTQAQEQAQKLEPIQAHERVRSQTSDPARTTPPEQSVLDALGFEPAPLDALVARTGLCGSQVQAAVLALELDGRVEWVAGGRLARTEP